MRFRKLLTGLCILGSLIAGAAVADQLPEPLVFQLRRLAVLYGSWDEIEEVDGRIIQTVPRGPNDEIVLTVFGVQRYGAATRTKQYVGVFVPEKKEPYAQHFRLVDVIRVDASGLRSIERLDAKVVFDAKSGETSIAVPALENAKGDATGVPGKKVAIQFQLKNGRLLEVGR